MPPFKTLRFASGNRTLGLAGSAAAADAPTVAPETVVGRAAAAASALLDFRKSRREVPAGTDELGSGVGAAPRLWMVRLLMGLPPVDMGWCGARPISSDGCDYDAQGRPAARELRVRLL